MKDDDIHLQDYFKELYLYEARERFKIKINLNKIRGNYKNMKIHKEVGWICVGCKQSIEVNSHIMSCVAYEDEKLGLDMESDKGLVEFFIL